MRTISQTAAAALVAALVEVGGGLPGPGGGAHAQEAAPPCLEPDSALAGRGQTLFTSRACIGCHTIGQGTRVGPDLAGVTARREAGWLRRFIAAPGTMLDSDSLARALLAEYRGVRMPDLRLTDEEVTALLHYIARESARAGAAICSGR